MAKPRAAAAPSWLVDVRTVPRSRHTPLFNTESLPAALRAFGIGYRRLAGLGGRVRVDSVAKQYLGKQRAFVGREHIGRLTTEVACHAVASEL